MFSKQDGSRDESRDTDFFWVPNHLDWYTRKKEVIILVNPKKSIVFTLQKEVSCPGEQCVHMYE